MGVYRAVTDSERELVDRLLCMKSLSPDRQECLAEVQAVARSLILAIMQVCEPCEQRNAAVDRVIESLHWTHACMVGEMIQDESRRRGETEQAALEEESAVQQERREINHDVVADWQAVQNKRMERMLR